MKLAIAICWLICSVTGNADVLAQERQPASAGVPLEQVITAVAKKSGKRFIVDGRVSGNVEILGQDIGAINYSDLLSILLLNGFTAIAGNSYISVIPIGGVRAEPLPMATAKEGFPDAQFVTIVVPVKSVPAPSLVPILRPLLPTYAHLAATPCINSIMIVDNFANVKRLEKLIAALDVGRQPFTPPVCEGEGAHTQGSSPK